MALLVTGRQGRMTSLTSVAGSYFILFPKWIILQNILAPLIPTT